MADTEYKHGEMSIETQEAGFNGFVKFLTNAVIVCIVILVVLAVFFQ